MAKIPILINREDGLASKRWYGVGTGALVLLAGQHLARAASVDWDPDSANSGIQGGPGLWNGTSMNWDNAGARTAWSGLFNSSIAAFSGTPGGNINIAASVTADSLRFDAPGFTIAAQSNFTLTLSGGSIIANADATVSAPIITSGALTKTGAGILTMSGSNSLGGNLIIGAGTLAVTADKSLGVTTNDVELATGRFRYTGTADYAIPSGRTFIVDPAGGAIDSAGGLVRLSAAGQLSGSGTLAKYGGKSLELYGANAAFSGQVNIVEGTLVLANASAINGRPMTLAGGGVSLLADVSSNFASDVSVGADSTLTVDRLTILASPGQGHTLGNLNVAAGSTLTIASSYLFYALPNNVQADGTIDLVGAGLTVRGSLSGAGAIRVGAFSAGVESLAAGLVFSGGGTRTFANPLLADDAEAGRVVVGVAAGTSAVYGGTWSGGGSSAENYIILKDGGAFTLGAGARINTIAADRKSLRTLHVLGSGDGNMVELASGFIADRSAGGTVADGLGAIEVRGATLVTRSTAGLPVVSKLDPAGATHRAGLILFSGTSAAGWKVASAAQVYDGGVMVGAATTIQTDVNLTHTGSATGKYDNQFQIGGGGSVAKTGAGWLVLSGSQGYGGGTSLAVSAGGVRFTTDPGAGWWAGNYARAADGSIAAAPVAAATLAIDVATGAQVEFATALSQIAALAVAAGGTARVNLSAPVGSNTLVTKSLSIDPGGRLDIANNRLVLDYDGAAGPALASLAGLVARGRNAGGVLWQGDGLTSGSASGTDFVIGFGEASDLFHISGAQTGSFGSATVDSTSILARWTIAGDADLDGGVGLNDLLSLANHYGTSGATWSSGDFDYDGLVGLNDLLILANHYGNAVAAPTPGAFPRDGQSIGTVPEPGWIGVMGVVGMMLGRRRGRR